MRARLCRDMYGRSSRNRKEPSRLEQTEGGKAARELGNLKLAPILGVLEDAGGSLDLTLRACLREGSFKMGQKSHTDFLLKSEVKMASVPLSFCYLHVIDRGGGG